MVHLSGNHVWSTLLGDMTHDEMIEKCDFHLVYQGRGIYAELVKNEKPLSEITDQDGIQSLVVGTLTTVGDTVINKLVHLGLGFGIDRTLSTVSKLEHGDELRTMDVILTTDKPSVQEQMDKENAPAKDVPVMTPSTSTTLAQQEPEPSTSGRKGMAGVEKDTRKTPWSKDISEYTSSMVTTKLDKLQLGVKESVKITQEMIDNLPK